MKNTVLFEPKFNLYEVVAHKTALTVPCVVIGYSISKVEDKTVTSYTLGISSADGSTKWFYPEELVKFDKNKALIDGSDYEEEDNGAA